MIYKYRVFLAVVLLIFISFSGCVTNPNGTHNESNNSLPSYYDDLPVFSSFSGSVIDGASLTLPLPQKATLVNYGKTEEIAPTDPRLIRLLNFILYSENQQLSAITTGLLSEEDIQLYYDACPVWLIISFDSKENNSFVPNLSEIVIFPSAYLLFGSQEKTGSYVEEHFPYEVLLDTWAEQNNVNTNDYLYDLKDPWMNMLLIAGFDN